MQNVRSEGRCRRREAHYPSRSDPTRRTYLVLDILVAELSFQVAFLALDDAAPHQAQDYGEQQRSGERVGDSSNAAVDQGHAQVEGVAGKPERTPGNDGRRWLVRVHIGLGPTHL